MQHMILMSEKMMSQNELYEIKLVPCNKSLNFFSNLLYLLTIVRQLPLAPPARVLHCVITALPSSRRASKQVSPQPS